MFGNYRFPSLGITDIHKHIYQIWCSFGKSILLNLRFVAMKILRVRGQLHFDKGFILSPAKFNIYRSSTFISFTGDVQIVFIHIVFCTKMYKALDSFFTLLA